MPNGQVHEHFRRKGRIVAYPFSIIFPLVVPVYGIGMYEMETFIFGVGIILGYDVIGKFMTCDWDIVGMTKDEGRMMNEIWFIGPILVGISTIYGGYFRRWHRSKLTHGPFISTAIRYLFVFWFPLFEMLRHDSHYWWFLFAGLYLGTCMSDIIHWYLDFIKYKGSE